MAAFFVLFYWVFKIIFNASSFGATRIYIWLIIILKPKYYDAIKIRVPVKQETRQSISTQKSLFETFVVPPEKFDAIPENDEIGKISHRFVLCKSGVEVFDRYEKEPVKDKEIITFYEEEKLC
ncbi:hypothetical protein EVD19_09825 [Elizabethkingia meningoseptica]|nr:hypothetical protein EVD19_09825 [Elizabethkingia meningoseptica]